MKALLVASIGGLAALIVIGWSVLYDTTNLQDDKMPSATGGVTRPASDGRADSQKNGAGAHDGGPQEVQALVDRILARPLFNDTRRPAATALADKPAGLPRLTAVLVSSRGKTVIFAGGADGKPVALNEGGRIGNYVVRSIGAGQVTVSGPEGMQVIHPMPDSAEQAPAPAVIAGPSIRDLLRQSAPPASLVGQSPPVLR